MASRSIALESGGTVEELHLMDEEEIRRYNAETLGGVAVLVALATDGSPEIAWGDTFFFLRPRRVLRWRAAFPSPPS